MAGNSSSIESSYPLEDEVLAELQREKAFSRFPVAARLLYQVYLDLKLVKNWEELQWRERKELELYYLVGRATLRSKVGSWRILHLIERNRFINPPSYNNSRLN